MCIAFLAISRVWLLTTTRHCRACSRVYICSLLRQADNNGNAAVVASHAGGSKPWPLPGVSRHGDIVVAIDGHDVSLLPHSDVIELLTHADVGEAGDLVAPGAVAGQVRLTFRTPQAHYRRPARSPRASEVSWAFRCGSLVGNLAVKRPSKLRKKLKVRYFELLVSEGVFRGYKSRELAAEDAGAEEFSVPLDAITDVRETDDGRGDGHGSHTFAVDMTVGKKAVSETFHTATVEECRVWVARIAEASGLTGLVESDFEAERQRANISELAGGAGGAGGSDRGAPVGPRSLDPKTAAEWERAQKLQDEARRAERLREITVRRVEKTQRELERATELVYQPIRVLVRTPDEPALPTTPTSVRKSESARFSAAGGVQRRRAISIGLAKRDGRVIVTHFTIDAAGMLTEHDERRPQPLGAFKRKSQSPRGSDEGSAGSDADSGADDPLGDFRSPRPGRTPMAKKLSEGLGDSIALDDADEVPADADVRSPTTRAVGDDSPSEGKTRGGESVSPVLSATSSSTAAGVDGVALHGEDGQEEGIIESGSEHERTPTHRNRGEAKGQDEGKDGATESKAEGKDSSSAGDTLVDTLGRPVMPMTVVEAVSRRGDASALASPALGVGSPGFRRARDDLALDTGKAGEDDDGAELMYPGDDEGGEGGDDDAAPVRPRGVDTKRHRRRKRGRVTIFRPEWATEVLPLTVLSFNGSAGEAVARAAQQAGARMIATGDEEGVVPGDENDVRPGDILLRINEDPLKGMTDAEVDAAIRPELRDMGVYVTVARLVGRVPRKLANPDTEEDESDSVGHDSAAAIRAHVMSSAFSNEFDSINEVEEDAAAASQAREAVSTAVAHSRATEPKALRSLFSGAYD